MFQEIRDMIHTCKDEQKPPISEGSQFILMTLRRQGLLSMRGLEGVKNMRYFFSSGRTTQSGGSHLLKPYPTSVELFHRR